MGGEKFHGRASDNNKANDVNTCAKYGNAKVDILLVDHVEVDPKPKKVHGRRLAPTDQPTVHVSPPEGESLPVWAGGVRR